MLTVHHLGRSQSERIVWLCEELGLEYELKRYDRNPTNRLAPPELKALHPLGTAPVISDGELVLAESGAIIEYIIARYGGGRLALPPAHPDYAQYLYWFHFANSNLQALLHRYMIARRFEAPADHPTLLDLEARLGRALTMTNKRLGEADYLAGKELTAADIMIFFSLTTMRTFMSYDLAPYPEILRYLQRIGQREAYRRAMQKGDPERAPLLS
jgi:glutathione S-transferase